VREIVRLGAYELWTSTNSLFAHDDFFTSTDSLKRSGQFSFHNFHFKSESKVRYVLFLSVGNYLATMAIVPIMKNHPAHKSLTDGEISTHSAGEPIYIVIQASIYPPGALRCSIMGNIVPSLLKTIDIARSI
jgi:hypothetical protein